MANGFRFLLSVFCFSLLLFRAAPLRAAPIGPTNGALVIVGGAIKGDLILKRFIELAGGPDSLIVVVPTANGGETFNTNNQFKALQVAGARNLKLLHTYDRKLADTEAFAAPLKEARGVWFGGGRQWRLTDAYLHTRTHRAFNDVLARGGVIGGSSAGATIQGSYLVRGDPKGNQIMMSPGHEEGLGFLKDAAIDQHIIARKREGDLAEVVAKHPELLGIGIDENTAIVVQGDMFEVIGASKVAITDPRRPRTGTGKDDKIGHEFLKAGDRFDLRTRSRLTGDAQAIPTGRSSIEVARGSMGKITVFTYKPESYRDGPLLFVFHGINRNADEYRDFTIALADRLNAIVAAPLFDKERFPAAAYNNGGVFKNGAVQPRDTWTYTHVPAILDAIRAREGRSEMPYHILGHSAGGQFVMRMAALAPLSVNPGPGRYVVANPGSALFPRRDWEFGYGFGGLPSELGDDAAFQRYLALPLTLYIGTEDVDPNHKNLDRSEAAMKQGRFRAERNRACFAYAEKLARERHWTFNWRKVEAPGIAHDGKGMFESIQADEAIFGAKR